MGGEALVYPKGIDICPASNQIFIQLWSAEADKRLAKELQHHQSSWNQDQTGTKTSKHKVTGRIRVLREAVRRADET